MARRELTFRPTRRQLLVGAGVGGALAVGWYVWPREYEGALPEGEDTHGFGPWLTIGRDGVVTVAVPQTEMGQGITTVLPQIVAQELGADWAQVAVQSTPPTGALVNTALAERWAPLWSNLPFTTNWLTGRFARTARFDVTAEGTALVAFEEDARLAGAAARACLAMAAGERWDVAPEECVVEGGLVRHGDKRARFGELAARASAMLPPDPPPLRPEPASEQPLAGLAAPAQTFPRIDAPAKVDGSFPFAADIRLPDMVFASIRHGPPGRRELAGFDADRAAGMDLVAIVRSDRYLVAAARNWWQADRALVAMRPRWTGPGGVDSDAMDAALREGLREEGAVVARIGEEADLPPTAARSVYEIAPAAHAGIEPTCATARYAAGRLELWIATQAPRATCEAAGRAIGIAPRDVTIYPMHAGGSFDARLEKQHAIEVAQIAREIARPVQLTWPRGEDLRALWPRAPMHVECAALLETGGDRRPVLWRTRVAAPPSTHEFGHRLFDNMTPEAAIEAADGTPDPLLCDGAVPPYPIPQVTIEHVPVGIALPTGRLRGNGAAAMGFATESFVDELASLAQVDPFFYRLSLLSGDARGAQVLRRAADLAGWEAGPGADAAAGRQGIAYVRMSLDGAEDSTGDGAGGGREGRIACIARAGIGAGMGQGGARVSRLDAVVDIGRIVNLDIARQQIEGGLLFGLAQVNGTGLRYTDGVARPDRLGAMGLPTLADAVEVNVDFIDSDAAPFDPGELGVAVAPPAICNALFAATGERYRSLPIDVRMPPPPEPQPEAAPEPEPEPEPEPASDMEPDLADPGMGAADGDEFEPLFQEPTP